MSQRQYLEKGSSFKEDAEVLREYFLEFEEGDGVF
jgi:hypothetical protein